MLFNSLEFIFIFLPALCILFFLVQNHNKLALSVLLAGSLCFYAYHSIPSLFLMVGSILFNFTIGNYISGNKKLLFFGVLCNVLIIFYFKYYFFIGETLNVLVGTNVTIEKLVLPLGISFFTFQQIAYLVDTYYGSEAERNIIPYALLVSFFPHSIAGPLVRYKEIAPQFKQSRISIDSITVGGTIFIIGLFKKIIIADGLAPVANAIFDGASSGITLSFVESWFGTICYTFQLYFDFSGYSDMAIGLAKIFNVQFPLNFNSPYNSTSIIDFWRRWHITLSDFLRNYVYIPLGGNQNGTLLKHTNLIATMFIGGLWHGANWTFVLWGLLHGLYLVVNHLWIHLCEQVGMTNRNNKIYILFCWMITMLSILVAWVLFRAPNIDTAINIYKSMFGLNGISLSPNLIGKVPQYSYILFDGFFKNQLIDNWESYINLIVASICVCLLFPNIKTFMNKFLFFQPRKPEFVAESKLSTLSLTWQPSHLYSIIFATMTTWIFLAFLSERKVEFLYFEF